LAVTTELNAKTQRRKDAGKLKEPNAKDEAFEEVVKSAQDAAVLVLVY
jgi:hypothetical protein